ncbi:serine protease 52-like [Eptesicus fuscus]|uniref:serine protease 52-like n=1 Tax=Eptesicus fuscus TaxID=29078 RepID=UPI0024043307|nr:serine protease 52-like [Eptesicus fuscus]
MLQFLIPLILEFTQYPKDIPVTCGETVYSDFERSKILKINDKKTAKIPEFPWKVNIFDQGKYLCGGSILNKWWILSASHCFINKDKSTLEVIYDDGKSSTNNLTTKKVDKLITHRLFDSVLLHNDIALLLLKDPFNFNSTGFPICLTEINEIHEWRKCRFAISHGGVREKLQKVHMELIEWSACSETLPMITWDMLCARSAKDWKDACQGDGGGALVCQKKDRSPWYQLGIVSWSVNCDQKNMIGVYTKVSSYLLWMFEETTTAGNTFMPDPDSGYNLLLSPSPIWLLSFVMLLLTL